VRSTKAEATLERLLCSRFAAALAGVSKVNPHVDTVEIGMQRKLSPNLMRELQKTCREILVRRTKAWKAGWRYKLVIQQPTPGTFAWLRDHPRTKHLITSQGSTVSTLPEQRNPNHMQLRE
jgi:hypothetical protein